jgi:phosphoglycolate phosphatase
MSALLPGIEAVIVDLDGTMIDTLGDFEVALNRMLRELQYAPIDRATIEQLVGKGSEHLVKSVLQRQSATSQTTHTLGTGYVEIAALASYQKHYLTINGQYSHVYPGVVQGLQALKARGLKMACLTNKPLSFAKPLLQAKGLDGFFSHVFGGDSFEKKKPDPLPLLKTCQALGTLPRHTLMIGDSSNDAQAAHAAGCPVVLMTYGYNHGHDIRQTPALAYLDDLSELTRKQPAD